MAEPCQFSPAYAGGLSQSQFTARPEASQRLRLLPAKLPRGEPPQLLVDHGKELAGGLGVAVLDGAQDAGDVTL